MHKVTQHCCFTAQDKRFAHCMALKLQASARVTTGNDRLREGGMHTHQTFQPPIYMDTYNYATHEKSIEYKDRNRHTNYCVLLIITE